MTYRTYEFTSSALFSRRVLTAGGIAAVILFAGCGQSAHDAGKGPGGMAMPVTIMQVKQQRVPAMVEAVGQTEGSREIEIRARVSGIVQKRLYNEGETVSAGTVLFQIDRAPYEIALDQAKAALAQEKARGEQVQREAGRMKLLVAEKAVSQKEFDDATSAVKQSEATTMAAEAKVREAELNLSYVSVVAPIRGITGRAQRSEGSLVTAGTDSALLTTLSQTDPIWVRFSFSEGEYTQLHNGAKKAEVRLVSPDGKVIASQGKLNFTASTVDPKLGTVQVRAEFPNPKLVLLPGQFVRVQVLTGEEDAFLVPKAAVMQGDQGRFVWIAGQDGKAAPRPVEAVAWSDSNWVVRNGLSVGDQVIVDNLMKIRTGAPVQPHTPESAPAGAQPEPPAPDAGKAGAAAAKKAN